MWKLLLLHHLWIVKKVQTDDLRQQLVQLNRVLQPPQLVRMLQPAQLSPPRSLETAHRCSQGQTRRRPSSAMLLKEV